MIDIDQILDGITIERLATSLSNLCRFNGRYAFNSIATHSVYVANLLDVWEQSKEVQLAGLLHDTAEGVITGDCVKPIKDDVFVRVGQFDFTPIREFEKILFPKILNKLNLSNLYPIYEENYNIIKDADNVSVLLEKHIMGINHYNKNAMYLPYILESPQSSYDSFMTRWDYLIN